MEDEPIENVITYSITEDQAEAIASHFNKNLKDLDEYEVCELLDRIIDHLA